MEVATKKSVINKNKDNNYNHHGFKKADLTKSSELARLLDVKSTTILNWKRELGLVEGVDTVMMSRTRRSYTPEGVRKITQAKGYVSPKLSISICNVKGGVGKTTVAVSLARQLSRFGFKTLLVDCDKQGNATSQLWPESVERNFNSLYDIITGRSSFEESVISISSHLEILPSNLSNQLLENEITNKNINKGSFFERLLKGESYDMVIFDTEPSLSQVNLMALAYSDIGVAPVKLDKNSVDGLKLLTEFVSKQSQEWPQMKTEIKALINGLDKRMMALVAEKMSDLSRIGIGLLETPIRTDQSFVRSQSGEDIPTHSKAYEDIGSLAVELTDFGTRKKARV